jgi:hypothetical protein
MPEVRWGQMRRIEHLDDVEMYNLWASNDKCEGAALAKAMGRPDITEAAGVMVEEFRTWSGHFW